ncbi:MAG: TfoX/Sxy family protein [Acidobacteriota bacterium]|nr:TfoX/Sxy family protein [Acidobacteriota bacterium]
MAYDETLADRVRTLLEGKVETEERKMFGGLAFMVDNHMCCGILDSRLMARIGREAYTGALSEAHVEPMDFTGRPLKGFVYVAAEGIASDDELAAWLERCLVFVRTLPAK